MPVTGVEHGATGTGGLQRSASELNSKRSPAAGPSSLRHSQETTARTSPKKTAFAGKRSGNLYTLGGNQKQNIVLLKAERETARATGRGNFLSLQQEFISSSNVQSPSAASGRNGASCSVVLRVWITKHKNPNKWPFAPTQTRKKISIRKSYTNIKQLNCNKSQVKHPTQNPQLWVSAVSTGICATPSRSPSSLPRQREAARICHIFPFHLFWQENLTTESVSAERAWK